MRTRSKRPLVILLAAVLVIAAAVGAYAYWTSDGTGEGEAVTAAGASITVVQNSDVTGMGPGVAAQTLSGDFDNANGEAVYVGSVTAELGGTDSTGCTNADYEINNSPMAVDDMVPAGNSQGAWSGATIAFVNDADRNQDACKGATVTIDYTIVETPPV